MRRFKNILLVYECDQATLQRAAALAKNNRARLTVIQVAPPMPHEWQHYAAGQDAVDLPALLLKEYTARLKQLVLPLRGDGVRIATTVRVGTPSLEIIRDCVEHQRDLVITTAEGKGGLKERMFGSTSLQLMRKCPCPVWVTRPSGKKRFHRILAAVDPDPEDHTRDGLNATIVELATSLAVDNAAELHVVHAWQLVGESLLKGSRSPLAANEVQTLLRQEADKHRHAVQALLANQPGPPPRVHVVKGRPAKVISRLAREHKVDLLVMGTICRTGIAGLLIGNTAETVLQDVSCSVLTVKPPGFVSPVQPV